VLKKGKIPSTTYTVSKSPHEQLVTRRCRSLAQRLCLPSGFITFVVTPGQGRAFERFEAPRKRFMSQQQFVTLHRCTRITHATESLVLGWPLRLSNGLAARDGIDPPTPVFQCRLSNRGSDFEINESLLTTTNFRQRRFRLM